MLSPPTNLEAMTRPRLSGDASIVPYRSPLPSIYEPPKASHAVEGKVAVSGRTLVMGKTPPVYSPGSDNSDGDWGEIARQLSPSLASILRPAGASRWLLPSPASITPQYVQATLQGALAGNHVQAWELFDLMIDTDPEIASCCGEYVDSIIGKKLLVKAYAEEGKDPTPSAKQKAQIVSFALRNMRPDIANDENAMVGTLKDLLFARFHGQTVLEIDWYKKDGSGLNLKQMPAGGQCLVPRSTFWVHPVCYAWDNNGRLGLRMALESDLRKAMRIDPNLKVRPSQNTIGNLPFDRRRSLVEPPAWNWISSEARPSQLMDFPENKFLLGIDKFKAGTIMGSGSCMRPLAWWWIASMYCGDWLLNYAQLFGIPFRKAKIAANTTEQKRAELQQMLQSMGSTGYCMLEMPNELEFERAASGAGDSPQAFLFHFANEMKRKVILRQTMTGGVSSGSKGIGKGFGDTEAEGSKDQLSQAGAEYCESVLNLQFVPYILNVNYGEGGDLEAPTVTLVDEEVGNMQDAQRDAVLSKLINIPATYLHQKYDVPEASEGEAVAGKDEGVLPPQPGGTGGYAANEEYADAPQDEGSGSGSGSGDEEAAEARAALSAIQAPPKKLVAPVTKALQDTAAPLVERMAAIHDIGDPEVKKAALKKLLADLPKITAALQKDPSLAEALASQVTKKAA